MKKTVLIHIDALRREYPAAWLLRELLKSKGFSVFLTSRVTTTYLLKIARPDILILSHPFTLSNEQMRELKSKGTSIYVTEVEGVFEVEHDIGTTWPAHIDMSVFSGIFVWNHWSKEWIFKNRTIDSCKTFNSGSIRNSLLNYFTKKKEGKKKIGILGRFECINPFDDRHSFENLTVAPRHHYDRWHADLDAFYVCKELTKVLLEEGIGISIRPHPNENVKNYSIYQKNVGNKLEINNDFDYIEWLESLDIVVGTVSSAFLEPYLLKIPIVCIDRLFDDKGPVHLLEWRQVTRSCAYLPESFEDLCKIVLEPNLMPVESKIFEKYIDNLYDLKLDGLNAITSVTEVIVQKEKNKPQKFRFARIFHKFFKKTLDALIIVASVTIKRKGEWSFHNQKQYNFNSFLHKPTAFMKKCRRRLLAQ